MRILNVSFKVISDSILESFVLDFKNLAALGAKVSLALFMYVSPSVVGNSGSGNLYTIVVLDNCID